jgi:hypothetical protein
VNDFYTYAAVPTPRGRRLFGEIDAWFHSSTDGAFDFETICQATGLDPDFVRRGLRSAPSRARVEASSGWQRTVNARYVGVPEAGSPVTTGGASAVSITSSGGPTRP